MSDEISKERLDNFSKMTNQICEAVIKPEIHPWDAIGSILQSVVVISAASGISLDDILNHINKTLTNHEAISERNRIEAEYKKEAAKTKNHLGLAPK
jgi:hypothetical protein